MLSRLGIRGKILAVVAVPILVLLVAASVFTLNAWQQLQTARNTEQLLTSVTTARAVIDALQDERDASANYVHTVSDGLLRITNARLEISNTNVDGAVELGVLPAIRAYPDSLVNFVVDPDDPEQRPAPTQEEIDAANAIVQQVIDAIGTTDPQGTLGALLAKAEATRQAIVAEGLEEDPPVDPETVPAVNSLDVLRELAVTENSTEEKAAWPTWPTPDVVTAVDNEYARLTNDLNAVAASIPVENPLNALVADLAFEINLERVAVQDWVNLPPTYEGPIDEAKQRTDSVIDAFRDDILDVEEIDANVGVLAAASAANETLGQLAQFRSDVMRREAPANRVTGYYRDAIDGFINISESVANSIDDNEVTAQVEAYNRTEQLVEAMRLESVTFERFIRQGYYGQSELDAARRLYVESILAHEDASRAANILPGIELPEWGISFSSAASSGYETIRDIITQRATDADLRGQRAGLFPQQVIEELEPITPVRDTILTNATNEAKANSQAALISTLTTAAIALAAVLASLILALALARRIINPLRRLTTTATAVRQELPRLVERVALPGEKVDLAEVQIPVESNDEIGRLAEAFNSVNAATLTIAGEQAALRSSISEMFVNVARRDQVLLNRQLASIDEMERTEDSPTTLTKLFALDHLATRMRRNAESLLVLAGIDTGRRLRRAMPLSDVIRTASSEIELYERVQLELDADPAMLGHSALTAAHLFAELLENATVFSDPGSPVIVRTSQREGQYVVEVHDNGIGMTPEELAEANARVASSAASEILGAQRLGLFVVGRIARRIGARVEITSHESEGTTAIITMPPSLFDARAVVDTTHTREGAVDENLHAPAALVAHHAEDEVMDAVPVEAAPFVAPAPTGYQPTMIDSGTDVLGGVVIANDDDDTIPMPVGIGQSAAPDVIGVPDIAAVPVEGLAGAEGVEGVEDLIAADASEAPVVEEFDLEELTGGTTESGLPARRRKAPAPVVEAERETKSIIGLPVRPTTSQLDALAQAPSASFQPRVSAAEVAPQTAEERSSMFRGFRSLRATEPVVRLEPDAESLGQALRRGAAHPEDIPALAGPGDGAEAPTAPSFEPAGAEPIVPTPELDNVLTEPASLAEEPTDAPTLTVPVVPAPPVVAPLDEAPVATPRPTGISHGYGHELDEPAPDYAAFEIPKLEIPAFEAEAPPAWDPSSLLHSEPVTVPAMESDDAMDDAPSPESALAQEEAAPSAGVESVSLNDYPLTKAAEAMPLAPAAPAVKAPSAASAAPTAAPYESFPAPSVGKRIAEPAALDMIVGTAPGSSGKKRGLGKLFGRKDKADAVVSPPVNPFAPPAGSVPSAPATPPMFTPPMGIPQAPPPVVEPISGSFSTASLHPALDEPPARDSLPAETLVQEPAGQGSWPAPATPPLTAPSAPLPPQAPAGVTPAVPTWLGGSSAPAAAPTPVQPAFTPAPAAPAAGTVFTPLEGIPTLPDIGAENGGWGAPTAPSGAFAPAEPAAPYVPGALAGDHPSYSADQLAKPLGWETAGASALLAAAPDAASGTYTPMQIQPADLGDDYQDITSAVFSEFSSLTAERPKVERTKVGLTKRAKPATPVVQPISAEVTLAPSERDADAVRNRFSSFYSGTHRARSDAENMENAPTANVGGTEGSSAE